MENFNVAGLASGFDWNAMIDQLMAIERVPQQRLKSEQSENSDKLNALNTLSTKLGALKAKVSSFGDSSLYNSKATGLSDETLNIIASASTSASEGKYEIAVTQLATASKRTGSLDVGGNMGDENTVLTNLRLATDITAGTFQINGQDITVSTSDTLQDVFDAISTATSGVVSASYDSGTDTVSLTSSSGQLELGSTSDDSNFLTALKLDQLEVVDAGSGTSSVTSTGALGVVDLDLDIASSGIAGPITGSDTLYINGVAIDFDADTESMRTLMDRVNASAANVSMTYDANRDQFRIVNKETGGYSMPVIDSGNGLLSTLGLTGSASVGDDLLFSVDGGSVQSSRSNVISSSDLGIEGLSVTASELGTQTITITRDSTALDTKISEFIASFNDVQDFIQEKTKIEVNDDEVEAAILAGNREVSSLDSSLRSLAFAAIDGMSGGLFRLEHMGIDFESGTSKLEVKDADALATALSDELDTLQELFMGNDTTSFHARMEDFLENYTASDGVMDTQKDTLTNRNSAIDEQIEEMERRLTFKREALEASFIAMEEAQNNFNNQATALAGIQLL